MNSPDFNNDYKTARKWWLFRQHSGKVAGEIVPNHYTGKLFRAEFVLVGKTTTFWMFTHDLSITHGEAVAFAQAVLTGRIHTEHFDISDI